MFKLNVKAFALASALVWGLGLFCLTWWIIVFDGASSSMTLIGRLYRGYTVSPLGSLIGLAWALPDGFVGGAIFAWLYNALASHFAAERRVEPHETGALRTAHS